MYDRRIAEYHDRLNALTMHAGDAAEAGAGSVADIMDSLGTILSYSQVDDETAEDSAAP